ncbi:ABC transporter substrate-binding protein [Pseudomonas sp. NPDC087358]|uniref:ABC transporter substrate-binding protein n=1 Tax=Pseudomonas sp. NPDC087358 TaxID=3364439 RepID=UPI003851159D
MLARLLVLAFGVGIAQATMATTIEAVTEDSSYTFIERGNVSGPASEIVRDTLRAAGFTDVHFALSPWARAYSLALEQPNVLIYPIVRTPQREALFRWVGQLARVSIYLYKFRTADDVQASVFDEAKHYTVGVVRDDARANYLAAQGFSKLVVSATNEQNFKLFQLRQVQMIPLPEHDAIAFCAKAGIPFTELEAVMPLNELDIGIYMAYSLATPESIVVQTVQAFKEVESAGGLKKMESIYSHERRP